MQTQKLTTAWREQQEERRRVLANAIETAPRNPRLHWELGRVLLRLELFQEAKAAFQRSLDLGTESADLSEDARNAALVDALVGMAVARGHLNEDPARIERELEQALAINPCYPDAIWLMTDLRSAQGRNLEASELLERLAGLMPEEAPRILHRAAVARAYAGDCAGALALLEKDPLNTPPDGPYLNFYGHCLAECGKLGEAAKAFYLASRQADGHAIWRWKHLCYCPVYFESDHDIAAFRERLELELDRALLEAPRFDWKKTLEVQMSVSFQIDHHGRNSRPIREKFSSLLAPSFPFERPPLLWHSDGRIRVGFVATPGTESGFLGGARGIPESLDPKRFDCRVFISWRGKSLYRPFPGGNQVRFHYLPDDFAQAAELIRQTHCDILYYWKAGGDPFSSCLPLCRLAPVQCTSWGSHGTCGIAAVDYHLSWDAVEIAGAQKHYTEKLVRFASPPDIFPDEAELVSPLPRSALGLPEQGPLYLCPHRPQKYHPDFDLYLRDLLEAASDAHILLLLDERDRNGALIKQRMLRNIGESRFQRVLLLPQQAPERYQQLLLAVDAMLDSPVYSGGRTSHDALTRGLPCVTQTGEMAMQRYTAAYYQTLDLGMEVPVATNRADYVAAAVRLGLEPDYRENLRARILEKRGALLNRYGLIDELESFFEAALYSGLL